MIMRARGEMRAAMRGGAWALLLTGILLWGAAELPAQAVGTVSGRVLNAVTRRPVESVQIYLVGARIGALTNADGRFTVRNVPPGTHELRAEMIGMKPITRSVTVTAGATVSIDFDLAETALALDEIIVTGTAGGARQRQVGNAVAVINRVNARDLPDNLSTLLQTQAPGMTVLQNSGQMGSGAQIRLRGVVSATMSNQPLVYIDGVRVSSEPYPNPSVVGFRSNNDNQSPLNDLNPSDVERIEVIKGAAASTLYGTEAAAGVIQIFTKRGRAGASTWTMEMQEGFQELKRFAPDPQPYFYLDPWLKKGLQQQYTLTVQGGGESLTYFVTGTLEDRVGTLPNESLSKKSVRGNFTFNPLPDLYIDWNSFFSQSAISNVAGGVNPSGFIMAVYRQKGNHLSSADPDTISLFLDQDFLFDTDHLNTGMTVRYQATEDWSHRLAVGYDLGTNINTRLRPWGFRWEPRGDLLVRNFRNEILTFDYSSTLNFKIRSDVTSNFSAGAQFVSNAQRTLQGYSLNFPGPSNPTLSTGSIRTSDEDRLKVLTGGFFAQNVFGFRDRVFVTTGARIDGNSAFGSGFGFQVYPKVSASWVIHEESFWNDSWGLLKVRAALGAAGRAPGAFDAIKTWNPAGWGTYAAYLPQNLGNPDLGPERALETELGFDYSIFDGRITTDFTWYRGHTKDALFPVRAIPSTGFQGSQLENVGELENSGIEFGWNARVLQGERVNWSVGGSIATNHSKVVSLGGAPSMNMGYDGWLKEGQPLMVMIGTLLLNPDELADPKVEKDHIFGPNNPTRIIGINTTLELPHQITLSAAGEYQGGNYMEDDATRDGSNRNITAWPTCLNANDLIAQGRADQLTAMERFRCVPKFYDAKGFIEKADFFKLRTVSLRFPLPVAIPRASSAFVTLSAHNWLRWVNSDFPIFEPEMMGSADPGFQRVRATGTGVTPPPATFMAAFRVVF
jgi:TonB-dependent starch-binding outer membrane protein SusC